MYRSSARILVVDDEVEVQGIMTRTMERAGFAVDAVGTCQQAREAATGGRYHLLLVDLSLPGESGIKLIRDLSKDEEAPAVIIITAHPSVKTAAEAIQLGERNYLTNPFLRASWLRQSRPSSPMTVS